ncbi:MAG TPA: dienelactone hydrolase family protein [Steroidobacteraceae bacterium]|nr:dienelactone hydrolase family protein [Steroidobacteraceae bacterium]
MSYLRKELESAVVLSPETPPDAAVIWLHGLGADGYDFVPIVPELHLPPSCAPRFVFPHAPVRAVTINNGMRMRAWYDILGLGPGTQEDVASIRASGEIVNDLIGRERASGIAPERIVIAGFSQGGAIALHSALRYGERLAGILALSTYLPLREHLGEVSAANGRIPILMCHGRYDPIVPVELAERSRDLLQARGYAVQWKDYGMQHQVCAEEIADIAEWLEQVLSAQD